MKNREQHECFCYEVTSSYSIHLSFCPNNDQRSLADRQKTRESSKSRWFQSWFSKKRPSTSRRAG